MEKESKILIVEDEKDLREVLKTKIENEGFITFVGKDGIEGLELAFEHHPDLILLDMIMPHMDGITMLKRLRKDDAWGKKVPVIILTNLADVSKTSDAVKLKVHDYLVKSDWKLEDLIKKIKDKLA